MTDSSRPDFLSFVSLLSVGRRAVGLVSLRFFPSFRPFPSFLSFRSFPSITPFLVFTSFMAHLAQPSVSTAGSIAPPIARLLEPTASPKAAMGDGPIVRVFADGGILCWISLDRDGEGWSPQAPGIEIEGHVGPYVQARVPLGEVRALAQEASVLRVGLPPKGVILEPGLPRLEKTAAAPSSPSSQILTEGLAPMRVQQFWEQVGTGRGVRIGIIDGGFTGYQNLLGTELPANVQVKSFYRNRYGETDITGDGEIHGTACAEVVHDVAPDAELYLANVDNPVDMLNATNWMIDQGVEVISHSMGWFYGPGDGTGATEEIAGYARSRGIIWVNAAGNSGQSHWTGPYRDANGNGIAEIGGGNLGKEALLLPKVPAGTHVSVILLWDRWPSSPYLRYELSLVTTGGSLLFSSEDLQSGEVTAYRWADYTPTTDRDDIEIKVRLVPGGDASTSHLRLFLFRTDFVPFFPVDQVPAGSIAMPADSPDVLAVGAYEWSTGALEPFSSRGPNTRGLPKPELLGPDGVSTLTYRTADPRSPFFFGTSASCPHVAGTVALLLGSSPRGAFYDTRWDADEIWRLLRENAEAVPDSIASASGWGRARLPQLTPVLGTPRLLATRDGGAGRLRLILRDAPRQAGSVQIFDVLGRLRQEIPAGRRSGDGVEYQLENARGTHLETGRYWAREPISSATVPFFWIGRVAGGTAP